MANPGTITKNLKLEAGDIDNNDPFIMYFRGYLDPTGRPLGHTLRSLQIILSDGTSTDVVKVNVFETGRAPDGPKMNDPTVLDALPSSDWSPTSEDWFEGASEIDNSGGAVSLMVHDDAHFTAEWIKVEVTRTSGTANDATAEIIVIEEVS
ncbi:MAG: hypothetical protein GWM98_04655 [Nitrospinaceae bacterium]|nr:hypothetical protein [Deltaproteobacteria bacterium]NIY14210.1 hypothetical protein [Nitrospinaceae bacterium]